MSAHVRIAYLLYYVLFVLPLAPVTSKRVLREGGNTTQAQLAGPSEHLVNKFLEITKKCPDGCEKNGNCNQEEGRCECPWSRSGNPAAHALACVTMHVMVTMKVTWHILHLERVITATTADVKPLTSE